MFDFLGLRSSINAQPSTCSCESFVPLSKFCLSSDFRVSEVREKVEGEEM